jgi:murein L,D-transpeptidase YcbB/YkuD
VQDSGKVFTHQEVYDRYMLKYYKRSVYEEWLYDYRKYEFELQVDEVTGEEFYYKTSYTDDTITYWDLSVSYYRETVSAQMLAEDNAKFVKSHGEPPENIKTTVTVSNADGVNSVLLKKGSSTTEAKQVQTEILQEQLNDFFGGSLKTDGLFGNNTANALKQAQAELGIPKSGVLDEKTLLQLELATTLKNVKAKTIVASQQNYTGGSKAAKINLDRAV